MGYWLATEGSTRARTWVKRFDPVYWSVDFPRPMMAAVVTTAPDALRVDAVFYRRDDLAGLIWTSADGADHPLLRYETSRDYRGCRLRFRWRSQGLKPLDAVHGPTLTIEGRDEDGAARAWYVRLWNYAVGSPEDAVVTLDFAALASGFAPGGEPVWAGDVDRMFVSLVATGYDAGDGLLAGPQEAWVELSAIACEGGGSTLSLGDVIVPPHGVGIATGYDDCYNLTPARLVRTIERLGYRGAVNHYVGMSHYYRLGSDGLATLARGALNVAAAAWHADFFARLAAAGLGAIVSLSYELFDANCPAAWKQRAADGSPALTGWSPPSTLLSPANGEAMGYLRSVAKAFVGLAVAAGQRPRFQIGEPWWWVQAGGRICLYDAAARAALGGEPVAIDDVDAALTPAQSALLDRAGALLAASTAALFAAVRAEHPAAERLMLVYLPGSVGERRRANQPVGWAGQFDVLQLEDYEWVTSGDEGASRAALAAVEARLGYPAERQHHLSGFVLRSEDRAEWRAIVGALGRAAARGVAQRYVWALPQVMRDGFTYFDLGSEPVQAFDDVDFPLEVGRQARVTPRFSTAVVTSVGGHEQRNVDWANARLSFDAGPGLRSEADIAALLGFFRARRGQAKAFRFRDPTDWSSNEMTGSPSAFDQILGTGDGVRTRFALVKRYGVGPEAEERAITRPVAASVRVSVDGMQVASGWSLDPGSVSGAGGAVVFAVAPAVGKVVRAGFVFDVPVRFASDTLEIGAGTWRAGEAASVELVEVRE